MKIAVIFDSYLIYEPIYGLDWLLPAFICFGQSMDNALLTNKDETLGTTTKIRQTARTPL